MYQPQQGVMPYTLAVQSLISAAIAKPEAPLSSLALLDHQAKAQIVEAFNATETPFPEKATLHSLFEKQASMQPTRTCIVGAEGVYTYGQVQEHANQVCRMQDEFSPISGSSCAVVAMSCCAAVLLGLLVSAPFIWYRSIHTGCLLCSLLLLSSRGCI